MFPGIQKHCSDVFIVTLEQIYTLSSVSVADYEQVLVGWDDTTPVDKFLFKVNKKDTRTTPTKLVQRYLLCKSIDWFLHEGNTGT